MRVGGCQRSDQGGAFAWYHGRLSGMLITAATRSRSNYPVERMKGRQREKGGTGQAVVMVHRKDRVGPEREHWQKSEAAGLRMHFHGRVCRTGRWSGHRMGESTHG